MSTVPPRRPLPLTGVQPLQVTALRYEIELIVALFNMASLNKSINALGSRVPPRCPNYGELTFNPWRRCKMQSGFTDRPSVLLHSHERRCKLSLVLHFHSLIVWEQTAVRDDPSCSPVALATNRPRFSRSAGRFFRRWSLWPRCPTSERINF